MTVSEKPVTTLFFWVIFQACPFALMSFSLGFSLFVSLLELSLALLIISLFRFCCWAKLVTVAQRILLLFIV